jgi:hypothetical protein
VTPIARTNRVPPQGAAKCPEAFPLSAIVANKEVFCPMTKTQRSPIAFALFGVDRWQQVPSLLPGVLLSAAVMGLAIPLADAAGRILLRLQGIDPTGKASPISGVLMAIVLGMLLTSLVRLPDWTKPGIQFSMTKLLRLGIIFVGIKLSVLDVLKLGAWGIPVVAIAIASGMLFVRWVNQRLHLSERLGTLLAAGTSICGVTAIVSTAPAIKAEEREVAYAVANVTLFGLLGMFLYPYLAHALLKTSEPIGLFLGTAIHETSQVVGAALTYKEVFQRRSGAESGDGDQTDPQPLFSRRRPDAGFLAPEATKPSGRRDQGGLCEVVTRLRVGLHSHGSPAFHRRCDFATQRVGVGALDGSAMGRHHQKHRRVLGLPPFAGHCDGSGRAEHPSVSVQGGRR